MVGLTRWGSLRTIFRPMAMPVALVRLLSECAGL